MTSYACASAVANRLFQFEDNEVDQLLLWPHDLCPFFTCCSLLYIVWITESTLSHLCCVVVGYMPNCIETVEAMLAAASIGAVWSATSPDFGVLVMKPTYSWTYLRCTVWSHGQCSRWLPIRQLIEFKTCVLVYNCLQIYHPAICPAFVSRSLLTPAADAYDQLHAVTSLSQPHEQSATALVALLSQDQPRGTRCQHHCVDQLSLQ